MVSETKAYCLLVVEDNPGDFILLKSYINRSQLSVSKICHAEKMGEVPTLIKEDSFDIVLLDLTLPDSKGVDSVVALDHLLPSTPIVVFSGMSTIEIAMESISLGAQDYLIKGEFDEKLLAKSIQYSIERKKTTERLRESNERYQLVNKATLDTIWEWDYATSQGTWGGGFSKTFGYAEGMNKYGKAWMDEFIHPHDRERVRKKLKYYTESYIENWQDEYLFRCPDGSYKDVFDRGYILFDVNKKPYRMIGAMTDLTEKKKLERKLADQQLEQQKLITEVTIQAQEKERNELGRELHDNINQILATIKMYIGMAKEKEPPPKDLINQSYLYVSEAMEEIRKLSHSLVAPSLGDIGLNEALEELVQEINISNNLQVELICNTRTEKDIDDKMELMLYRIAQEQMNNILKYSQAKKAVINLQRDENNVFLIISDDGLGFDTSKTAKGIGLRNIHSRAEFYSGTMSVISAPGKGCTLEITIPY